MVKVQSSLWGWILRFFHSSTSRKCPAGVLPKVSPDSRSDFNMRFRTKEKGEIGSPLFELVFVVLLLFVEFDGVAGVDVFQCEDDHGG